MEQESNIKTILSEIVAIKILSANQSVFLQKKPEFKDRYCELLLDESRQQLILNIYKLKGHGKRNLYTSNEIPALLKMMTDDGDDGFQLVFDSMSDMIMSFNSRKDRNRWMVAIKQLLETNSTTADSNNLPSGFSTQVDNENFEKASKPSLLSRPSIETDSSINLTDLRDNEKEIFPLKGVESKEIENISAGDEVGPPARFVSHHDQIGEASTRPRRHSKKGTSISDGGFLGLQLPATSTISFPPAQMEGVPSRSKPNHFSTATENVRDPSSFPTKFNGMEIIAAESPEKLLKFSPDRESNVKVGINFPSSTLANKHYPSMPLSPLQMAELITSEKPQVSSKLNTGGVSFPPFLLETKFQPPTVDFLQSEVDALSAMNDQLNAALEKSEQLRQEEVTASLNEISRLRLVLEEAMNEKQQLEEGNATVNTLEEKIANLEKRLNSITLEKESLLHEHQVLQGQYQKSVETQQALYDDNQRLLGDDAKQKVTILDLQQELMSSQTKQQSLLAQIVSLNNAQEHLLQLNQHYRDDLDQQTKKIELLEEDNLQIQSLQNQCQDMEQTIQFQHEQIELLKSELSTKTMDNEAKVRNDESNKLTIQRLESLIHEQQQFIQEISEQLSSSKYFKQSYEESQVTIIQKNEEIHRLTLEKQQLGQEVERLQLQAQYNDHEKKQKDLQYDELYQSKQKEISSLKDQYHQLQLDYDHLQNENTILQRRMELQKEHQVKLTNDEQLVQRRYQLELQSLQAQLQAYKESLDQNTATVYDLQRKLQTVEEEKVKSIHDYQVKLSQQEDIQSIHKKTIHDMNQRLHQLDITVQSLQESLQKEKQSNVILEEQILLQIKKSSQDKAVMVKELQHQKDILEDHKLRLMQKEKELLVSEQQRRESQEKLTKLLEDQRLQTQQLQKLHQQLKEEYQHFQQQTKEEKKSLEDRISSLTEIQHQLEVSLHEQETSHTTLLSEKVITAQQQVTHINQLEVQLLEKTTKLNDLQQQYKSIEYTYQEEKKKSLILNNHFLELQQQYAELQDAKEELQLINQQLKEEMQQGQKKERKEMEMIQYLLTTRTKELQEQQDLLHEKEILATTRIQSLEETVLSHVQMLKEKNHQLQQLEKVIQQKELEIKTQQTTIQQLELQQQSMTQQTHSLSLQLIEKENLVQEKERFLQDLQVLLSQKTELVNQYEKELLPDQQKLLKERQQEIQSYQLQLESLSQENRQFKQEQQEVELQIQEFSRSLQRLEEALVMEKQQGEKSRLSQEEVQRQLANALKTIQSLEQNNRDEIQHWNQHLQEIEGKFQEDKDKSRQEIQQLHNDVRGKDITIMTMKQENQHLVTKLSNTEELLSIAQQKMEDMVSKEIMKKEIDPLLKENYSLSSQLAQSQEQLQQKELQFHQLSEQFQYQQQEIIQKLLKIWKEFQASFTSSSSAGLTSLTAESRANEGAVLPTVFRRVLEERNEYSILSDHLQSLLPTLLREEQPIETINENQREDNNASVLSDQIIVSRRTLDRMTKFSLHLRHVLQQIQYLSGSPRRPALRTTLEAEALSQQLLSLQEKLPTFLQIYHQHFQAAVEDYQSISTAYRSLQSECQELRLQRLRLEETIQWMKDQKQSVEDRHQQELALLQKELNQSFADQEVLQEEHAKYLTKMKDHWEDRMKQQQQLLQSQHQDEQQLLQAKYEEELKNKEQLLQQTKDASHKQITRLQQEIDSWKQKDAQHIKQIQQLTMENTSYQEENSALLHDLQEKSTQLLEVTNNYQLLEYQMAKESREKLQIERNFRKTLMMKEKNLPVAAGKASSNNQANRHSMKESSVRHAPTRSDSPPPTSEDDDIPHIPDRSGRTVNPPAATSFPSQSRSSSFYDRDVPYLSLDQEEEDDTFHQSRSISGKEKMKEILEQLSPVKSTMEEEILAGRQQRSSKSPNRNSHQRLYPSKVDGLKLIKERILHDDDDPNKKPSVTQALQRSTAKAGTTSNHESLLSDRQAKLSNQAKDALRSELSHVSPTRSSRPSFPRETSAIGEYHPLSEVMRNRKEEVVEEDFEYDRIDGDHRVSGNQQRFNRHPYTRSSRDDNKVEKEENEEEDDEDEDFLPEEERKAKNPPQIKPDSTTSTRQLEQTNNNAYKLRMQLQNNPTKYFDEKHDDGNDDDDENDRYDDDFHSSTGKESSRRKSSSVAASETNKPRSHKAQLAEALRESEKEEDSEDDDDDDDYYSGSKSKHASSTQQRRGSNNRGSIGSQRLTLKDLN